MRRSTIYGLIAVSFALPLAAQEHEHLGTERLGRVVFPVSCNEEAQRRFERAMTLLHSFWWEEGERAFQAVAEADSSCAMAYWGLALTYWGNPLAGGPAGPALAKGAEAIARATALRGPTARERSFITAVRALYRDADQTTNTVRLKAYADTMARLYSDVPNDVEVSIYYALALVAAAPRTDTTFANQKKAAAILNPLYARFPDHPGLAHYIIHANDSPRLASLGLAAARRYAEIAPSAPHAQHMPSHIFIRLGLWEETIASNQRAFDAGVAYARSAGLARLPYEQFHALDYMVYASLQLGADRAARRIVDTALTLAPAPGLVAVINGYNLIAMELRLPLERGDWSAAAQLPVRGDSGALVTVALARFARGIGAARSGNAAAAGAEASALDSLARALTARSERYWARVVGIERQLVSAWAAFAAGDTAGALTAARTAADMEEVTEKHPVTPGELLPARELEADLHLAAGHYAVARGAYLVVLRREPGRARSVYGAARAAELAGDRAAAAAGYREYLALMEKGDGDRPELAVARAFIGQGSP